MAGLDLQKQMEEAAVERSGIAKALLGIQKSLDQIAPSVPKMEPVLASLELVVHDLTAWRPGVDAAMDQLQTDLGDIRAELEKIALHTSTGGKAVDSSTLAAADALRLGTDPSGDDHGPDGHRRAPPSRALLAEGPILPIPGPNNGMAGMWLLNPDIDRKHRAAIGSERKLEALVTRTQKEDWKIHEG